MGSFEDDTLTPRSWAAAAWTSLFSLSWLAAALAVSLAIHSPLTPLAALQHLLASLTQLSSLPVLFLFTSLVLWSSLQHSSTFLTSPSVLRSWSSLGHQLLSQPRLLVSVTGFSLVSTSLAWCFLQLGPVPYSTFLATCSHDSTATFCFNEQQLFLLASAAFTGAGMGLRYNFFSENSVTFPIIYKDKSAQVKQRLRPLLVAAVAAAVREARYFYTSYVLHCLVARSDPTSLILDCLDLHRLAMLLTLAILLIFLNSTRLAVFSTFVVAPLPAALEEHLATLQGPSSHPLHRLLSFQHLATLTAQCSQTRREIFSLSQPGGHPHTWNSLRTSCLASIDDITTSVTATTAPPPPKPAPAPAPAPVTVASPMRRLAPALPPKVEELAPTPSPLMLSLVSQRLESLKSKPLLSAVFQTSPEHAVRAVLCRCQAVRWAVDILANLAAASVTEDRFGVVQKDLPALLTSLLSLEQSLAKTRGLVAARETQPDQLLRQELRHTVKSGLYRISIQFGEHILQVPLPKEFRSKMASYQRFMES